MTLALASIVLRQWAKKYVLQYGNALDTEEEEEITKPQSAVRSIKH
jgi:hypothetical protein